MRLQRILLLRELGLGLPQIGEVLHRERTEAHALENHLALLRQEQDRLARQIASVERTIDALRGGERLMAENMFDGFDHTQYKDEVEERWGKDAYARCDAWWRSMTADEKRAWQQRVSQLGRRLDGAAATRRRARQRSGPGAREAARRVAERHPRDTGRRRRGPEGVRHRVSATCTSRTRGSARTTAATRARTIRARRTARIRGRQPLARAFHCGARIRFTRTGCGLSGCQAPRDPRGGCVASPPRGGERTRRRDGTIASASAHWRMPASSACAGGAASST